MPCNQSMLAEDLLDPLSARDAFAFRSIVGICLYLAHNGPDVSYSVKELSSYMSKQLVQPYRSWRSLLDTCVERRHTA